MADGSTFNGIEHLGSMEREHRCIAEITDAYAVFPHAESVGGIIDYLQSILYSYALNSVRIADVSVNVNGKNCTGPVGHQGFDLEGIHGVIVWLDIAEDRFQALADDRMRG